MNMRRQISVSLVWSYGTSALRQEEATSGEKVFGDSEHFIEGCDFMAQPLIYIEN
jgi:hypothetical protein